MNHTEAAQYIKATLTAFGPGEAISMTKETWAKIHEAMQVLAQPEQEPVAWRDHIEQRLLTWRQSFVNKSGDQLALDDFMDKQSLDDLIDFVCDEYTTPSVPTSDTSEKRVDETAKQRHEQEPVAWPVGWVDDGGTVFWKDKPPADGADLYTVIDKSAAVRIATALGWTPQRTWVGLTDEQIGALLGPFPKYASEWGYGDFYQFARDIEAKLKEKNT